MKSHGIEFEPCEHTTSENYLTCLPLLLANRVRLVDNVTLRNQLTALERKPTDAGRAQVSHPHFGSAHDDVATAVSGAVVAALVPVDGAYDQEILRRVNGNDLFQPVPLSPNARLWGPQQAGAVDLGDGGYRVPTFAEQTNIAFARAEAEAAAKKLEDAK
jgi:hypothetical protein